MIMHGDIEINIEDETKLEVFLAILRGHNYQSVEDIWNLIGGEETIEEVEEDCDENVRDGFMWRYIVNGEKYYVLNPDKRDEIKEMSEETEGDEE